MKSKNLRDFMVVSLLCALSVVLRMFALGFASNNRLILHNLPLIIIGLNFGPTAGVLAGIICDVSSCLYQPGWDPLFIVTTVLWGLIPGLLRDVYHKHKIGGLIGIEILTHLLVSLANTIILGVLMGWNVALGTIKLEKSYDFIITLFEQEYLIFHLGQFVYLRIIFVLIIMQFKIPLDIMIIHAILKRKIVPNNYAQALGVKYAKKI
ncbi:MAG: ECF transporter S component [Acholeplasmatales bacterium]|jgi:ECF transporter S component (folate family)|nr:ECF transporter S component [Acholeplasmatales bacterium]